MKDYYKNDTCPECDGKGYVEAPMFNCSACFGTGKFDIRKHIDDYIEQERESLKHLKSAIAKIKAETNPVNKSQLPKYERYMEWSKTLLKGWERKRKKLDEVIEFYEHEDRNYK